jgi:hypothetical protein
MRETGASNDLAPFMFKRIFRRRPDSLADCPACGADFVYPVEWYPEDEESWRMLLRCGACHVRREAIVSNLDAAQFDRELDIAEASIRREADLLSREHLAEEAERFATALELDLIDAEDFARS